MCCNCLLSRNWLFVVRTSQLNSASQRPKSHWSLEHTSLWELGAFESRGREVCLGVWAEGGQTCVRPCQCDTAAIAVSAALLTWIPSLGCVAQGCAHSAFPFVVPQTALFLKLKAEMSECSSRWELTSLKTCQHVYIFNFKGITLALELL